MGLFDSCETKGIQVLKRLKDYIYLHALVSLLWDHWKQPCKECDYGDGGHCLIEEDIKLRITYHLKLMERKHDEKRNSGKLGKGAKKR
jgi:hypothetical protein